MTVLCLASLSKPLLAKVRQRLSASSESCFVVLPPHGADETAGILAALGLTPDSESALFRSMPGLHRLQCGRHAVFVSADRGKKAGAAEVVSAYDEVWTASLSEVGRLRRYLSEKSTLHTIEDAGFVPPWLCGADGVYRIAGHTKSKKSTYANRGSDVLIVGAGLAGAMTAWSLSQRGCRPIVVDAGSVPGSGASALCAGLIHPHWQASDSPLFQLTRAGYERMVPLLVAFPDCFIPCGVVDAASSDEEYARWVKAYESSVPFAMPETFAFLMTRVEASARCGLPLLRGGWYFPKAGLVRAGRLCRRLTEASGARVLTGTAVKLERRDGLWTAVSEAGSVIARSERAVAAAGRATSDVLGLDDAYLQMSGLYGRISLLRDTDVPSLRSALTGDGYLANTPEGFCAVGATYEPGIQRAVTVEEAHEHNLSTFEKLTGSRPAVLAKGFYEGVRAVASDRMPLAGRGVASAELTGLAFRGVPEASAIARAPGLWICAGLGSRGITWGLACADLVAADICGEPLPLPASLVRQLDPVRFVPKLIGTKH